MVLDLLAKAIGKGQEEDKTVFMDLCSFSTQECRALANGTPEDRAKAVKPISEVTKEDVLKVEKMSFLEEASCVLLMAFGVPNGVFTFPPLVYLVGRFLVGNVKLTATIAGGLLLPLAIMPQKYVPSSLQSWMSIQVGRYFSYRMVVEKVPEKNDRPRIMVAPPHGVFPYGKN